MVSFGGWCIKCVRTQSLMFVSAPGSGEAGREAADVHRGVAHQRLVRPYALTPEMWQNSIGKMCVLDGHNLKEVLPARRKHFR